MDRFQALFGIDKNDVKKTVLLLPFLPPQGLSTLGIKALSKGAIFASRSIEKLTVIKTGIGATFVSDAVLYLKDTACENILFLGSCGLVNKKLGLRIGGLVIPTSAHAFESPTDIITCRMHSPLASHPDTGLLDEFQETTKIDAYRTGCASFGSFYHENAFIPVFKKLGADVVEMECAALFHAAIKADKKALALLFISDVLGEKPIYLPLSDEDKKSLSEGSAQACQMIKDFSNAN